MGNRPTAPKRSQPPVTRSPGAPLPVVHEATARVAAPKAPLPNVFWGALGCVCVLGVGFTVMFFVARPGAAAGTLPPPVALPPAAVAAPAQPPGSSPYIQPMNPPAPPPPVHVAPAEHTKPGHSIKVARAPSGAESGPGKKAEKKAKAGDDQAQDTSADSSDDSPAAKKSADSPAADKPADPGTADDDQTVPRHRERASDDPDDD